MPKGRALSVGDVARLQPSGREVSEGGAGKRLPWLATLAIGAKEDAGRPACGPDRPRQKTRGHNRLSGQGTPRRGMAPNCEEVT